MSIFPSGAQHEIIHGDMQAVVVEVGGGLRTFQAGNLAVLDGFASGEMCHDARGQILMPWPNRIAGGTYHFAGRRYQLPINEPEHNTSIHGLVRWENWTQTAGDAGSGTSMAHRLYASPGYPFILDLTAHYVLDDGGLTVTLEARNMGTEACPFGAGQHPYVRCDTALINTAVLQVPATSTYRVNDQFIPIERVPVAGTPYDFRTPRPIGETIINLDYTDLERDATGRARVTLQNPDSSAAVEVWMDESFKHVMIYTGETVQPPERQRQGLAVEPMTCPPNAFNSGEDLLVLQPGEQWQGRWGIAVLS